MDKIVLHGKEKELFENLIQYNSEKNINATLRVAGGWVRDKVMGFDATDIDIAIDRISGTQFANGFLKHLRSKRENVHGFHVIPYNHEKAKHLETACMVYHGYRIDFVSLRSEEYANTRIPVVKIGTPEEDTFRRDLTINALFYNINTAQIEDYTGKGLSDIRARVVRTPMEPKKTFQDDPLRILRALRFAARLKFSIAPEIHEALEERALGYRLREIVSRERIGQEIKKIFESREYGVAVEAMIRYRLMEIVFTRAEIEEPERVLRYIGSQREVLEKEEEKKAREIYHGVPKEDRHIVALFSVLQCTLRSGRVGKVSAGAWTAQSDLRMTKAERGKIEKISADLVFLSDEISKRYAGVEAEEKKLCLIGIARRMKNEMHAVFSIYLLVLKSQRGAKKEILNEIPVVEIYDGIVENGYTDAWKEKCPVDPREIQAHLKISGSRIKECAERLTEIGILHKTKDKASLLDCLEKRDRKDGVEE